MIQEIITILIVSGAAFIVGRNLYRQMRPKTEDDACGGCASSCGGCPVMELKTQIEEAKEKKA
jgi:hypothetical protein